MSVLRSAGPGLTKGLARGFTLLELLLVVAIISVMLAVTFPVSYSMLKGYQASLRAEEVLLTFSRLKRETFLYSEAHEISSTDENLSIDGDFMSLPGVKVWVDAPIKFYGNGTSSGGMVNMEIDGLTFRINIQSPSGTLLLERMS